MLTPQSPQMLTLLSTHPSIHKAMIRSAVVEVKVREHSAELSFRASLRFRSRTLYYSASRSSAARKRDSSSQVGNWNSPRNNRYSKDYRESIIQSGIAFPSTALDTRGEHERGLYSTTQLTSTAKNCNRDAHTLLLRCVVGLGLSLPIVPNLEQ